jgi:hypothetical protein
MTRRKWPEPGSRVKRVTQASLFSGCKRRKVVVSIYPDGTVGYRLLGERREYFRSAVGDYAEAAAETKARERAARKRARRR